MEGRSGQMDTLYFLFSFVLRIQVPAGLDHLPDIKLERTFLFIHLFPSVKFLTLQRQRLFVPSHRDTSGRASNGIFVLQTNR